MRKMKKFSDGGSVPDFSRLTFKEAFAAARGQGGKPMNKEFTWNGKRYTTELAEDKPASKAKGKDTRPDESAAESARLARAARSSAEPSKVSGAESAKASSYSAKSDSSELGTLAGAAAAALLGGAAASRRRTSNDPDVNLRLDPGTGSKRGTRGGGGSGGAGSSSREMMLGSDLDVRKVKDALRREEADDRIEPTFKKGGSVSSASKRADGCAMRGKTKGKIY